MPFVPHPNSIRRLRLTADVEPKNQSDQSDSERFFFFRIEHPASPRLTHLPAEYRWSIWKPALNEIIPAGIAQLRKRFAFRWLMHQSRLFSNRDYQVLVIRHAASGEIAHYSGATGQYWRWPFMRATDMQIGDTWTDPAHRARGLAKFALVRLLHELTQPGRHIWYVVGDDNPASIAIAQGAGMTLVGEGTRTSPRVLGFLHAFEMNRPLRRRA